jgi:hypothetical protein
MQHLRGEHFDECFKLLKEAEKLLKESSPE